MSTRDAFKVLFDALQRADEEVDHAEEVLTTAVKAQRRCHTELWAAIHAATDAQADQGDLRAEVAKLQTLVLELTAKLNGR